MSDVFLSHHSADKPAVEALAHRLRAAGLEPWLDKWNLIPGNPWQIDIERALNDCAVCAVFMGPNGVGPWQNEEMRAAIDRRVRSGGFRVIPVLLPGGERGGRGPLPTFLSATTWVEFRDHLDDEDALHRLMAGIRGQAPGPGGVVGTAVAQCPYRGLQVFEVEHAPLFFGRGALTQWLLEALRPKKGKVSRFLAMLGASGSGKSSLARAGLLAPLGLGRLPDSQDWRQIILKPGAKPLESLAIALCSDAALGQGQHPAELMKLFHLHDAQLHWLCRQALHGQPDSRRVVLLVDQFEEIFTLCTDEAERLAFIANLLTAATDVTGRAIVVLTLRADFYGRCAPYPQLAAVLSEHQILISPMSEDDLREAIIAPAQRVGCELEPGLIELLLQNVKVQPGGLPLLEYTLTRLWEKCQSRVLRLADYHAVGGLAGALNQRANEIFSTLSPDQQGRCRQVFLRLVQPGEGTEDTCRRASLSEFGADAATAGVIRTLADARLITTDQGEGSEHAFAQIAHEALIRNWSQLRGWIDQDRDALRTQHQISQAAGAWDQGGRDPAWLLTGSRLHVAQEWLAGHSAHASPLEREFLQAGQGLHAEQEQYREWQRRRELRQAQRLFGVVLVGFLIAAALAVWGFVQTNHAEEQTRIAQKQTATAEREASRAANAEEAAKAAAEKATHAENTMRTFAEVTLQSVAHQDTEVVKSFIKDVADSGNKSSLLTFLDPLLAQTESMDADERQYWRDILPSMTLEQTAELLQILFTERQKLNALLTKYQPELSELFFNMENGKMDEAYYQKIIAANPKNATALVGYARLLSEGPKHDYDRAEVLYQQATNALPNDAGILGRFAAFESDIRKDYDRAEKLLEHAIGADPKDAQILGAFAFFMSSVRKDYDRAEKLFEQAIGADPKNATNLGAFAVFMKNVRKDYNRAEKLYEQAIGADPKNARDLGNFAIFMQTIRKDAGRAEELYQRAIAIDPSDANQLANLAQLKLINGNGDDGRALIDRSFSANPMSEVKLELWFYRLAHFPQDYPTAQQEVLSLLKAGVRDEGWDFSGTIARAERNGHANVPLLTALADVILNKAKIESLASGE